jgi:hypothetical protein
MFALLSSTHPKALSSQREEAMNDGAGSRNLFGPGFTRLGTLVHFRHFPGLSGLAPVYPNQIMFAHDLRHRQIEYFKEFFKCLKELSKK